MKSDFSYAFFQDTLKQFGIRCQYIEKDNYRAILEALESGAVDAGLVSRFFGLRNENKYQVRRSSIIIQGNEMRVGIVVDQVWELLRLEADRFQPPPKDVGKIDEAYFKAVSEVNDRMLIVLDVNKILTETRR